MTGPEPAKSWYARNVLPAWVPIWLAASFLIALGFGVIFGLYLEDEASWRVGLVAGGVGFALGLVILSIAAARSPNTPEGQRLAPPAVIRKPILIAVVTLWPYSWMTEARVSWSPAKSWKTLFRGTAAEVCGVIVVVLIVAGLTWITWDFRRRTGRWRTSDVLSLAVAVLMFVHGLVVVVRRHS